MNGYAGIRLVCPGPVPLADRGRGKLLTITTLSKLAGALISGVVVGAIVGGEGEP